MLLHLGSLVITDRATYFMGVSAGAVEINGSTYYCISLESPIGKLLLGKKEGDTAQFNDTTIKIKEVV